MADLDKAKVMSVQEAKKFCGDAWFEIKRTNILTIICTLGDDYLTDVRWQDYGRTFRIWTARPTEEQRKDEPWKDGDGE